VLCLAASLGGLPHLHQTLVLAAVVYLIGLAGGAGLYVTWNRGKWSVGRVVALGIALAVACALVLAFGDFLISDQG
jgi:hypothetical protein